MSRSRRKPYVPATGGDSMQADWKRESNRRLRRRNKIRVAQGDEPLIMDEIADLWSSPHDGGKAIILKGEWGYVKYSRK